MPNLILLDNGSSRAESTLSLRRMAAALEHRIGKRVHPISLLHANKVPADALEDRPADTLEPFLWARTAAGEREHLVLPLFFGPSRALTSYIPEMVAKMRAELGTLNLEVADVLCPLPGGEARLTQILIDNIERCATTRRIPADRVVLVDHGSPIPEVTQVRRTLARELDTRLGTSARLEEAVMERRPGTSYDFNGDLLEDTLRRMASEDARRPVILSMLFMFPGRHAGPGGDVEQIHRRVQQEFPGFRVHQSGLVGAHPGVIDILQSRLEAVRRGIHLGHVTSQAGRPT